jgi:hypothetical protein
MRVAPVDGWSAADTATAMSDLVSDHRRRWLELGQALRNDLGDAGLARADRLVEEGAETRVVNRSAQRIECEQPLGLVVTLGVELGHELVDTF